MILMGANDRRDDPVLDLISNQEFNTDLIIKHAWACVNEWFALFKKDGLLHLRKNNINPLFHCNVSFW